MAMLERHRLELAEHDTILNTKKNEFESLKIRKKKEFERGKIRSPDIKWDSEWEDVSNSRSWFQGRVAFAD